MFLHYTRDDAGQLQSVLAAYTSPDGGATLDPASEQVLLTVNQPFDNHNGGHLAFGPDGMLYMALGDGGSGGDPENNAQNTHTLLGKILRLDVSERHRLRDPGRQPFRRQCPLHDRHRRAAVPGDLRLRSAQPVALQLRLARTGELWVGDVGQGDWEEVDRIVAGGNYGWRFREGAHCFNPPSGCPTQHGGDPLIDPDRRVRPRPRRSVTGGYVYRGTTVAGARRPLRVRRFRLGADLRAHARLVEPRARRAARLVAVDQLVRRGETASSTSSTTAGGLYRLTPVRITLRSGRSADCRAGSESVILATMRLKFTKMHGLGNDFIVFDAPRPHEVPSAAQLRRLADRRTGIGFDQALVLSAPRSPGTDVYYRIFNADGSEVEQCGNGARCIATLVADGVARAASDPCASDSPGGVVEAVLRDDGHVSVAMGVPDFDPRSLPFDADARGAELSHRAAGRPGRVRRRLDRQPARGDPRAHRSPTRRWTPWDPRWRITRVFRGA